MNNGRERSSESPAPPGTDPPPDALRIGWIASEAALRDFSRVFRVTAIGLIDELLEVVLFCGERCSVGEMAKAPTDVIRFSWPRWFVKRRIARLAAQVRRRKIDLLHALDARAVEVTRAVAREVGISYVVSSHDLDDARRIGTLEDRAAGVLASSTPIQQNLLEHHVTTAEKISLVRPGVHTASRPTCFCESGRHIGLVAGGPMDREREFEPVLRAFAELHERKFECAFFVMGGGPAERRIRRRVSALGLNHELTFAATKSLSQFAGIAKAADVYVSVAPRPQLTLRALLAMAAGTVVLSPEDPAADFLIDGQTAMLFRPEDPAELTTKLVALLDDPDAARSLAQGGLDHVAATHSPSDAARAVAEIYRRALRKDEPAG